jgi:hypothetical protein
LIHTALRANAPSYPKDNRVAPFRSNRHRRRRAALLLLAGALITGMLQLGWPAVATADSGGEESGIVYLGNTATPAGAGDVVVYVVPYGGGAPYGHATTDAAGRWRVNNVPVTAFHLYLSYVGAGDYSSQWDYGESTYSALNQQYSFPAGQPAYAVLGTDQTLNGQITLGATSVPAQGLTVDWWRLDEATQAYDLPENTLTTDSQGAYSLLVQSGQYKVTYQAPDATYAAWQTQTFIVNKSPVSYAYALTQLGTISGRVLLDSTSAPASAGEIQVSLSCASTCTGPLPAPSSTNANGDYAIGGLPAGSDFVLSFASVTGTPYFSKTLAVTVADTSVGLAGQNVTMNAVDTISGFVSLGEADNPAGAGEVTVNAYPGGTTNTHSLRDSVTTAADGSYTLDVPAGQYSLEFVPADATDYATAWWQTATSVTGAPGNSSTTQTASSVPLTGIDATVPYASYISGTVTLSDGTPPPAGEQVNLGLNGILDFFAPLTFTSSTGTYSFGPIAPGNYVVDIQGSYPTGPLLGSSAGETVDDPLHQRTIVLSAGETVTDANAVQFRASTVDLTTSCTNCVAPSWWGEVKLQYLDPETESWVDSVDLDHGAASARNLYPGEYRPEIATSAGEMIGDPFQLAEGQTVHQTFTISVPKPTSWAGGVGDLDGDGNQDLIARDPSGDLWLYPGNGASGFLAPVKLASGWQDMTAIVSVGDMNGDGKPDLVARHANGSLWFYPGNGSDGFGTPTLIGSSWMWGQMTAIQGVADFDLDGNRDLVARDPEGDLWLYPGTGTGALGPRREIESGLQSSTSIVGIGDFNNDGAADLLVTDATGTLRLYSGYAYEPPGQIGGTAVVSDGWQGYSILAAGDFNNDGCQDVIAVDPSGDMWLYPGNGAGGFLTRVQLPGNWSGYTFAGAGDSIPEVSPFTDQPLVLTVTGQSSTNTEQPAVDPFSPYAAATSPVAGALVFPRPWYMVAPVR